MTFLDEVKDKLDLPPTEKQRVMRELESHYSEIEEELLESGISESEAASEASRRMGDPGHIASRMQAVYGQVSWKSAFLAAAPFLCYLIGVQMILPMFFPKQPAFSISFTLAMGVIMLAISLHELVSNKRPLWISTWLPFAFTILSPRITLSMATWLPITIKSFPSAESGMIVFLSVIFWRNMIDFLILGVAAVYLYRKSSAWQLRFSTITSIGILLTLALVSFIFSPAMCEILHILIVAILLTAIAMKLFAWHLYGCIDQVLLFLFTYYAAEPYAAGIPVAIDIDMINIIVATALIILFSRSTKWWESKIWILIIGGGFATYWGYSWISQLGMQLLEKDVFQLSPADTAGSLQYIHQYMENISVIKDVRIALQFPILAWYVFGPLIIDIDQYTGKPWIVTAINWLKGKKQIEI
ncbi:MAG: HAAS signaling domain-containing protein [Armatimonadota bacterium]